MVTVKETVESKINPITLEFSNVTLFEGGGRMVRSFLVVNSLDLGVLTYGQYRFVARRTKLSYHMVKRHIEKLFRKIPELLSEGETIDCFTVPVYARVLMSGELAAMLVDMISLYPEIPVGKICIELSADILYEDLKTAAEKIDEIRELGVKVAIFEVGDEFCPVFRLSEIRFDYAFIDTYSVNSLDTDAAERVAGSLIGYLHHLKAKVIAPGLDTEERIRVAQSLGADGYTVDRVTEFLAEGGDGDEEVDREEHQLP